MQVWVKMKNAKNSNPISAMYMLHNLLGTHCRAEELVHRRSLVVSTNSITDLHELC